MSDSSTQRAAQPTDSHRGLRLLALAAVALGVVLLAAAAFVLSYAGIHAVALTVGVSPRLARIYPLIFDAMLVVTCAAVLALRGAGLPSRIYGWLSMLALLAAAAAADALHATGTRLPRRPAAATAAVIPWVLVLIGFGLLLCMLRQARLRRAAAAAAQQETVPEPSGHVAFRRASDGLAGPSTFSGASPAQQVGGLSGPSTFSGASPAQQVGGPAGTEADLAPDLAIDAEPGQDDPAVDEARLADLPEPAWIARARDDQPAGHREHSSSAFSAAPTTALISDTAMDDAMYGAEETGDLAGDGSYLEPGTEAESEAEPQSEAEPELEAQSQLEAEPVSPPPPPFDRMRSSPIPPGA